MDFSREANESCILLDYYGKSIGNFLPMLRDKLSFPSSKVKNLYPWR